MAKLQSLVGNLSPAGLIIALIHWVVTFFTDHLVFEALPGNGVAADFFALPGDGRMHFILCKLILLVLLIYLWSGIAALAGMVSAALRDGNVRSLLGDAAPAGVQVLKYALLYLIPILAVLAFKLPEGFLSNDETLIFGEASRLATYTWFYYLTTYYYIVTMMLLPCWLGPVLTKVFLQLAVCGYVVYRSRDYLKDRYAFGMYLPFFLPPVLAYTTSAHRIPAYYLLYLLLIFKLVMDRLCKREAGRHELFLMMVLGAVLTQWRTEGIYMLGLLPILLFLTYPNLRKGWKRVLTVLAAFFLIEYLVTIPQNGFVADRLGAQADNRMGPFWAYTVTNMYRNGLDMDANREDLQKVWRYLDKDTLEAINRDLGDINYEDVLILYYSGYTGKLENAGPEDYAAYVEGCKSLFLHNPGVLLKTRIGAFCYAAMPYHITFSGGGVRGLVSFGISVIKTVAYDLFIPWLLAIGFWIYALIRRRWQEFFIWSGIGAHWLIVFVLAPASYFKYYFPIYMTAYFFLIWKLILLVREKRKKSV